MSFVVSARKYRPQIFDDVVGQEHITTTLKNSILNGRVSHAYLFTGPRGVGKTTTARILAKSLNCKNPKDAEPCQECVNCKDMAEGKLMDVYEIDAASNRGIDEVRSLRESVKYKPTQGEYKIYIIDEVHMLSTESFNAFLKTLEEPPDSVVFIFATTDIHKVPATIISRCQRYDFRRIPMEVTKQQLKSIADQEEIKIDDKTLTLIAKKSDGGLRDAESFFDQTVAFCGKDITYEAVMRLLNLVDDELYFSLVTAFNNKDYTSIFKISHEIHKNGWDMLEFLDGLIEHLRNLLSVKAMGNTSLVETAEVNRPKLSEQALLFDESDLMRMISFIHRSLPELRYSGNRKIRFEMILCQLAGIEKTLTIAQLIHKVEHGHTEGDFAPVGNGPEKKKLVTEPHTKYTAQTEKQTTIDAPVQAVSTPVQPPQKENKPVFSPKVTPPPAATQPLHSATNEESSLSNQQLFTKFLEIVRKDRGVIMDEVVKRMSFKEIRLGKLYAYVYELDILHPFLEQEMDYLNAKVSETFKKPYALELEEGTTKPNVPVYSPSNSQSDTQNLPPDKQEVIDYIKTRLGGMEMVS